MGDRQRILVRRDRLSLREMDSVEMEESQRVRHKKRRSKKRYLLIGILLFLFVFGSVLSVVGYLLLSRYRNDLSQAQTGIEHMQKAATLLATLPKNPLSGQVVGQAQHEFASALTSFVQLNDDLRSLPAISTSMPVYGTRLRTVLDLVPIAIEASQAGVTGCTILNLIISRLHDPLSTQAQGITMTDFTVIEQKFRQIKGLLNLVIKQVNSLPSSGLQLDPRLNKAVLTFRGDVPIVQGWLNDIEKLLPVVPTLLGIGTPTHYLIQILDSTELRPAGGFIGNYGIVTLEGGRLTAAHITDVYLLDRPFEASGKSIPFPPAYAWFDLSPGSWSLRDSNLDADFPTAARYAELNYGREGGTMPVQGVIAITPTLIQLALAITGPIGVPEYQETVTAQNLIARIHYYQLATDGSSLIASPDGHSSQRKRFTELLAEHFLARVRQLAPSALSQFFKLMISSVQTKDLQIYLDSPTAENLLQRYHMAATIEHSVDDSIFVVDANISPNKANNLITNTLNDQVTLDAQGNAIHRTTLRYAWTSQGLLYGSSLYRDYVRVYVPYGSLLRTQDGWQPRGTSEGFDHEVWVGLFTLTYGQTRTITLIWSVPHAAVQDTHGWHYRELIQRQAGALWTIQWQMLLPSCATLTSTSGTKMSTSKQRAMFTEPLNQDVSVEVNYVCKIGTRKQ